MRDFVAHDRRELVWHAWLLENAIATGGPRPLFVFMSTISTQADDSDGLELRIATDSRNQMETVHPRPRPGRDTGVRVLAAQGFQRVLSVNRGHHFERDGEKLGVHLTG